MYLEAIVNQRDWHNGPMLLFARLSGTLPVTEIFKNLFMFLIYNDFSSNLQCVL